MVATLKEADEVVNLNVRNMRNAGNIKAEKSTVGAHAGRRHLFFTAPDLASALSLNSLFGGCQGLEDRFRSGEFFEVGDDFGDLLVSF